jgi:hypothetical protein
VRTTITGGLSAKQPENKAKRMPRQNRVTPWGESIAVPDRGLFMGNRGTLHDANGWFTSQRWTRKAWVTCQLSFKGRHRQVMAPGQYTELFFLDEATALAAGHRPCATCRREDYSQFTQLWVKANAQRLGLANPSSTDIGNTLHQERFISSGWQDGWHPSLKDLPDVAALWHWMIPIPPGWSWEMNCWNGHRPAVAVESRDGTP